MPKGAVEWARRWAPELVLAALAGLVFLGFLGSVDLWGKREQRASAEAIDTIRQGHWLVAQIQGRPRLEKPPLPRWTIAFLMLLTGRQDEWVVRLPSALSALGMVALVYALGSRLGGRSVGLASGLALASLGFFISEVRQAGNDGPLAFFTTLALYAAWRRLHGGADLSGAERLGARGWSLLMYIALGLGFLTKGPIIVLIAALTLVPYLACAGRLRAGLAALWHGWGILLFLLLALSWPVPVLMRDSKAAQVWYLEMAQKAVSAGVQHHRTREFLVIDWPWFTAPWVFVATFGLALPFARRGKGLRPKVWFPWWWTAGNLAMFCFWKVAKPNYYLPCLPGAALLTGIAWVRLARRARSSQPSALLVRRLLQLNWAVLLAGALVAPAVVSQVVPHHLSGAAVLSAAVTIGVGASIWAWRRGANAGAMMPLTAAMAVGVVFGYGVMAPADNPSHSHRALAATLDRIIPPERHTVMFFHELDEGLWFYLRDRDLQPVPGSQPRYNAAVDLNDDIRQNPLEWDPFERENIEKRRLLQWLRTAGPSSPYLLIRAKIYDRFAPDLDHLVEPLYRERGLKRNELVLLRVNAQESTATGQHARPLRR
jgi:4-amino-4-deoxy-L-arabinose transferase-like glycosyltransferase